MDEDAANAQGPADEVGAPAATPGDESPRLAAAFVAAALAAVTLGALALLRYDSPGVNDWLTWRPAAEMSGPGAIALGVFGTSWLLLALLGRPRRITGPVVVATLALLAVALVLAAPPFDQLVK